MVVLLTIFTFAANKPSSPFFYFANTLCKHLMQTPYVNTLCKHLMQTPYKPHLHFFGLFIW